MNTNLYLKVSLQTQTTTNENVQRGHTGRKQYKQYYATKGNLGLKYRHVVIREKEHTREHSRTKSGKKAEGHKTEQHKTKTNKIKQEVTKDRITNGEDDLARNGEHRERSINEIRALIQTNKCQEYNPANHDIATTDT